MVSVMASMPLAGAPRERQLSTDSDGFELLSLDDGSSTDAEDYFDSSDCPGTSAGICR